MDVTKAREHITTAQQQLDQALTALEGAVASSQSAPAPTPMTAPDRKTGNRPAKGAV